MHCSDLPLTIMAPHERPELNMPKLERETKSELRQMTSDNYFSPSPYLIISDLQSSKEPIQSQTPSFAFLGFLQLFVLPTYFLQQTDLAGHMLFY